jgi:glycosyltransferase involved in cell wall biosynthesis
VLALEEDPAIRIYGQVDDALPYFRKARVIVVPLRIGSGIRVKIVQALAARRSVVTTAKGCEGLEVDHGEHLVIADSPAEFAEATVRLLESPEERRALGERGHELVARRHDALSPQPPLVLACEKLVEPDRGGEQD